MEYNGEHLLPGQLGQLLILFSLAASFTATASFYYAGRKEEIYQQIKWLQLGRWSFFGVSVSVIGSFATLVYIITKHYHEYYYAWNHSSVHLQPQYLLASLWEGQEGSFLLWNFWNCILGLVIISRKSKWEPWLMTVISFAQFCIATMLLGVYIFGQKIGIDPFILFRHQMPQLPLFSNTDYLNLPRIKEGNDLNVLLQNYWMVIHPPILFLGFASTIVPFAFAYAGMVSKDHSWTKASLPWTSFSAAVLGTGIMMGAAWAYESLNFGGYWAWDPVENASLVPWLLLVAGLHTNLVYNHSGYSLRTTYLFYLLCFSLVLYSSFLTRSGVLGDTSVHAFTGADMKMQLLVFLLIFFVPGIVLFFIHRKSIPAIIKEEATYSREFWMFIGSLILFLSAVIIIAKTSVPVYNLVFGAKVAMPEDTVFAHNQVQIFIAIIIGMLTAITQYLKYRDTKLSSFAKKILWPSCIALIVSVIISVFGGIHYTEKGPGFLVAIHIALWASIYAVIANAAYIGIALKGKLKASGASVAHVGFGLILVGILLSSAKKQVLSQNTTGIALFEKSKTEDPAENITLFKGLRTDMNQYHVTYVRDTSNEEDRKKYFEIKFEPKDNNSPFYIYPDVLANNKGQEGFSANPDKEHFWNRDIFVYASSFQQGSSTDTASFMPVSLKAGDTAFYSNGMLVLNKAEVNPKEYKYPVHNGDIVLRLNITVISKEGQRFSAQPSIILQDSSIQVQPDTVLAQSLVLKFNKMIDEQAGTMEIGVKEDKRMNDIITLKVYEFPFINILWLGIVVMIVGFLMSMLWRMKQRRLTIV
jgi:cytochrome c-type biogenesis protein CcmF